MRTRLTLNNIEAQALTKEKLIHWAGAQPDQCPRKDSGIDVETEVHDVTTGPHAGTQGTITHMGVASHYGNITCLRCRKIAWKAGVR